MTMSLSGLRPRVVLPGFSTYSCGSLAGERSVRIHIMSFSVLDDPVNHNHSLDRLLLTNNLPLQAGHIVGPSLLLPSLGSLVTQPQRPKRRDNFRVKMSSRLLTDVFANLLRGPCRTVGPIRAKGV